jgi:eukaryotic-like serine/threonine-protein kinase
MRVCLSCKKLLKADATRCPADGSPVEVVETLAKDTRLGAYRIDRMLGEGGMGFVYEATHEVLNRRTAIKMLRPELASHAQIVTRFLNEAKAVNLIDHQNIVNVYDYGDNQHGSVYFVMEFLEGETLDDLMRKRQPMPVPLLLHLFAQIAKALAAAHAKRIVHRDLKPANVFIVAREDNPYFIKLLDFGIAQLRGAGAVEGLTISGQVMGTPQYMSPEQVSGGTVDARSDVWAMGVMLYRAATGQAPFKGEEFVELADKILHHVPPPAASLVALPASLSTLIASCLERRVEARCASVTDLIAGLERVKQECKLDDDAILAAVRADAGTLGDGVVPPLGDRTRGSLGGSLPRFQGGPDLRRGPGAAPVARQSRLGSIVAAGVAVLGLGGAAYAMLGRPAPQVTSDGGKDSPGPEVAQLPPGPGQIVDSVATGDLAGAHQRAERALRDAIATGTLLHQGLAVDALARVRVKAAAPLLYEALRGAPDVRIKAARALAELGLPDAAPKLRAALAGSGDKVKVEIAAALHRLGDKDARAILLRALDAPGQRLSAAAALADAEDPAGRAVLAELVQANPVGSEAWRRAVTGLCKLGDASARGLLMAERSQPDARRAIGAAELLARLGDSEARDQLARMMADLELARRGDAAEALARLGDQRALGWVAAGLASSDPDERVAALAICGLRAGDATAHLKQVGALVTQDVDPRVKMTAAAALLGMTGAR